MSPAEIAMWAYIGLAVVVSAYMLGRVHELKRANAVLRRALKAIEDIERAI